MPTAPVTAPEVGAIAMRQPTTRLPRIVGRAPVAPAPRPPADISHPAAVYRSSPDRPPIPDTLLDEVEDTGSLTGQVLARGITEAPRAVRGRTALAALAIVGVVVILIVFGLFVATSTSDAVSSFFARLTG